MKVDDPLIQQLQKSLKHVCLKCPICISHIKNKDKSLSCNHCHVLFHTDCIDDMFKRVPKNSRNKIKCPTCNEKIKHECLEDHSIIYRRLSQPFYEDFAREIKSYREKKKRIDFACAKHNIQTDKYCGHCNQLYCQICFNNMNPECSVTNIHFNYEKESNKVENIATEIPMIKMYFMDKCTSYYQLKSTDKDLIMELAMDFSKLTSEEINSLLNYIHSYSDIYNSFENYIKICEHIRKEAVELLNSIKSLENYAKLKDLQARYVLLNTGERFYEAFKESQEIETLFIVQDQNSSKYCDIIKFILRQRQSWRNSA